MQTSVKLQEMMRYSILPIIIVFILIIIGIILLVRFRKKKEKVMQITKKEEVKVIPEKNIKNIPAIKNKFLKQLEKIEKEHEKKNIELRESYQKISILVRTFIFEVTDIKTQNYSLKEIEKLNMPEVYDLIKEFYKPEFSEKPEGDFLNSINKVKEVINKWH